MLNKKKKEKKETEHSWFKMYGIKFGPNVTHLVLMFYLLLQVSSLISTR